VDTRHLGLAAGEALDEFWPRLAREASAWLREQGLDARDAVLLLPFAQHIAPARRAWVRIGGWAPRITTSHSLASALVPTPLAGPQQLTGDAAIDAFTADGLLAGQSWARELKARDPRAYATALTRLVETAQALRRASDQRAPAARAELFALADGRLTGQATGPGDLERALALVALAWVRSDTRSPATDALFALRPSAWIVLRVGGSDPLAEALLAGPGPALCLDAELDLDTLALPASGVELALCPDFETLAEQSATAVLQHLEAGRAPVALLAQDRVVVRRVRALLERQGVPLHDETGWTLATTPAAAALMALLRAVILDTAVDDWLAWLKSPLARSWPADELRALEALCRRRGWRQPLRLDGPAARPIWQRARALTAPLTGGTRLLTDWLASLQRVLRALDPLDAEPGGAALLDALWLTRNPWPGSAHAAALEGTRLRPDEFLAWVDASLEAAQFTPVEDAQAVVVITPLARALLRPFGAIVLPGADLQRLAPPGQRAGLLADADAQALGLSTLADEREAQALAFAQLLRAPWLTVLRATHEGAEPLSPAPLLERLEAALGQALPAWVDHRVAASAPLQATQRAAAAPARLPASLSPSSIEALRNCPYQFFSRSLLGLHEPEELEQEPDKRDYGTWLHAVLARFHAERGVDDAAGLRAAAQAELARLDEADFLPFAAAFERLLPRYLAWLAVHEAAGARFAAGEAERTCQPFTGPLAVLGLQGRIDRIDATPAGPLLLDYKTGKAEDFKTKVEKTPLEDTQLAAYALLMGEAPGLQAAYLPLDEPKEIKLLLHPRVRETAEALRAGLQADLAAVLAGRPLVALGEGRTCDYCEARGLCRKDDWTPTPASAQAAVLASDPAGGDRHD
jgi:ATP-dependent helicase/nuclease subunit B